jgi:hypothetical protein
MSYQLHTVAILPLRRAWMNPREGVDVVAMKVSLLLPGVQFLPSILYSFHPPN